MGGEQKTLTRQGHCTPLPQVQGWNPAKQDDLSSTPQQTAAWARKRTESSCGLCASHKATPSIKLLPRGQGSLLYKCMDWNAQRELWGKGLEEPFTYRSTPQSHTRNIWWKSGGFPSEEVNGHWHRSRHIDCSCTWPAASGATRWVWPSFFCLCVWEIFVFQVPLQPVLCKTSGIPVVYTGYLGGKAELWSVGTDIQQHLPAISAILPLWAQPRHVGQ